jgi:hypothetical protein
MTHKEYADSLRLIADWFEQHEGIPLPGGCDTFNYFALDTREEMAMLARMLGGKVEKEFVTDWFKLKRKFGEITFIATANRSQVCRRVVIGKKKVVQSVPVSYRDETVEVDDVEWQCDEPIFKETPNADSR